jgi:hypothetical protein
MNPDSIQIQFAANYDRRFKPCNASPKWVKLKAIYRQCADFLAHLLLSGTPPATIKGQLACDEPGVPCRNIDTISHYSFASIAAQVHRAALPSPGRLKTGSLQPCVNLCAIRTHLLACPPGLPASRAFVSSELSNAISNFPFAQPDHARPGHGPVRCLRNPGQWNIHLPVLLLRDRMTVRDPARNAKFQLTLRQIRRNLCQVR